MLLARTAEVCTHISHRAGSADWLQHLGEPANSSTVVFSASCVIQFASQSQIYVSVGQNGNEDWQVNKERKEDLLECLWGPCFMQWCNILYTLF